MSSIPPIFGRVPSLLAAQSALGGITRTQIALFQVQQELSSGRAISRFSDDAVKAAAISYLNDRLATSDQHQQNLDAADSSLSTLDSALSDASDLVLQAKSIASAQVGIGSTAAERQGQAQVVNSLIQTLMGIANRESPAGHVFAGSTPGSAAVGTLLGGYQYLGQGSGLLTDLGLAGNVPITIGGNNAIGSTSARVSGDVNLDPGLTTGTRLVDLSGARGLGVSLGRIEFSFNGSPPTQIDLTGADSIGDVATRIQNALRDYQQANNVTILGPGGVSVSGGSLRIDVAPATSGPNPTLQFTDIGNQTTAQDLGLADSTPLVFSATSASGRELSAKLTWQTPISALRGVTGALGSIRVNNLGQSRIVDLSGAQTLEDVKNLIEGTGIGIRVQLNADKTGIDVVNDAAAGVNQAMSIEEVSGNNMTATRLGIRSLTGSTRISDFNDGRGVKIVDGSVDPVTGLPDPTRDTDFSIKLGDSAGTTFDVDLRPQDMATVQTVIDRINQQAQAAGVSVPADFEAGLSDSTNGLVLKQNASFAGPVAVTDKNGSPAADQLGLTDGTYDASTGTLRATDHAKVRVDNLFTNLIDLRDALMNNDTSGITLAGEKLESATDRIAQTRALVGGYARQVTDGKRQEQDRSLLDEQTRSNLQDVDYSEAAIRLNMLQTQLQAGLQTTAASFSRSLLDFLG
jgi:flagellin-like hook-associated protein FlgL